MKIICVGRNYVKHIEEMKAERMKDPVIFLKPEVSYTEDKEVYVPEKLGLLHYEVELCLRIGKRMKDVKEDEAKEGISHFTSGLDLTLRELQSFFKKNGLPWSLCKGFDNGAPFADWIEYKGEDLSSMNIYLYLNGEKKQYESTSMMIFSPFYIVSYVSSFMTLEEGDIVMTGTPKGVGELKDGDIVKFGIEGIIEKEIIIRR